MSSELTDALYPHFNRLLILGVCPSFVFDQNYTDCKNYCVFKTHAGSTTVKRSLATKFSMTGQTIAVTFPTSFSMLTIVLLILDCFSTQYIYYYYYFL